MRPGLLVPMTALLPLRGWVSDAMAVPNLQTPPTHGELHGKAATAVVKEPKPQGIADAPARARRTLDIRTSGDMKKAPNRIDLRVTNIA